MKRAASIDSFLRPLSEAKTQVYLSNAIQVVDITEWIIEQIGECDIWQTSFSISEEYLRRLYFMKNKNKIRSMSLILDHKATNMTIKLWVFIDSLVKNTYLADNHSKILLFKSIAGECVSVVTSQNLTRGNRYESTVVSTEKEIFDILKTSVEDIIKNRAVPLSELMQQASPQI